MYIEQYVRVFAVTRTHTAFIGHKDSVLTYFHHQSADLSVFQSYHIDMDDDSAISPYF